MFIVSNLLKAAKEICRYQIISIFTVLKPRALMVVLTYKCNSKCRMCNIWKMKKDKEFSRGQWKSVFMDNYLDEVETLTITGGESMLNYNYVEIVEDMIECLPRLKRLVLTSNGFLTKIIEENVKRIVLVCRKKNIRLSVSISLDGIGCDHDEIRGIKGSFNKVIATLDCLKLLRKKYGITIFVAGVLMKDNLNKYWSFKKWLKQKKLDYNFQLIGFHEAYVNNQEKKVSLNFTAKQLSDLQVILEDIKKEDKNYGLMDLYWDDMKQMYLGGRRHTPCPFLYDEITIDCLGNVYFCLSTLPIGNIVKENKSLQEIYTDKKNRRRRSNMWVNECVHCNSSCDVIRAIVGNVGEYIKYRIVGSV